MKHDLLPRWLYLLLVGFFTQTQALRAEPAGPPSLAVPAGQVLALTLTARGVQIYECRAVPEGGDPGRFEWVFKAPEADLYNAEGRKVGKHYAGPTWELVEGGGGKVVGRVKAKAEAPDGRGIPWLLLEAAQPPSGGGSGVMDRVRSIQRVDTVGGQAPTAETAEQAKAGQERRVAYSATYRFYIAKP